MVFWIVSVPYEDSNEKTLSHIKKEVGKLCDGVFPYVIPTLKIGSMNGLFELSDELSKQDSVIEQICFKILRTFGELVDIDPNQGLTDKETLKKLKEFQPMIELGNHSSVPAKFFLEHFSWDEKQYLINKTMQTITGAIYKKIQKLDEELRVKYNEYHNVKTTLVGMQRKAGGPLTTRPLDGLIDKDLIVESDYLKSLFVIIPKNKIKDWESSYAHLEGLDMIVPQSSEKITEDEEYALMDVVLIKKIEEDFKTACKKHKYLVRDFVYDEQRFKLSQMQTSKIEEKLVAMTKELLEWCKIAFSETFSSWLHIKAIRLFIESILRYGLPPRFTTVLINVGEAGKYAKKVHHFLAKHYGHKENQEQDMFSGQASEIAESQEFQSFNSSYGMEFHPYVLLSINTDNALLKCT